MDLRTVRRRRGAARMERTAPASRLWWCDSLHRRSPRHGSARRAVRVGR